MSTVPVHLFDSETPNPLPQKKHLTPDKPIIFQDIDGVLNNEKNPSEPLSDAHIQRLAKLANDFDAQIVLSSHWRKFPVLVQDIKARFSQPEFMGLDKRIVGATPNLCEDVSCRASEVLAWRDQHKDSKEMEL